MYTVYCSLLVFVCANALYIYTCVYLNFSLQVVISGWVLAHPTIGSLFPKGFLLMRALPSQQHTIFVTDISCRRKIPATSEVKLHTNWYKRYLWLERHPLGLYLNASLILKQKDQKTERHIIRQKMMNRTQITSRQPPMQWPTKIEKGRMGRGGRVIKILWSIDP